MNPFYPFYQLWLSVSSPDFYRQLLTKPRSYAVKFLIFLIFLNSLIFTTTLSIKYIPLIYSLEEKVPNMIEEIYPGDLILRIDRGLVSTNVSEPYHIEIPKSVLDQFNLEEFSDLSTAKIRLLTIDTRSKPTDIEKYQSIFLLGSDSLTVISDDELSVYPLKEIEELVISEELILDSVNDALEYLKLLLPLLPLLIFLLMLIIAVFEYGSLSLVTGVLALFISKALELNLSFRQLVKMSIFALSLPFLLALIEAVLAAFNRPISLSELLPSLVLMLALETVALLAIKQEELKSSRWFVYLILAVFLLPLYLIVRMLKSSLNPGRKLLYAILAFIFYGLIWSGFYTSVLSYSEYQAFRAGYSTKPITILVVGKSMLPSIQDGQYLELLSPHRYPIARGDIVSFQNPETGSYNYIKRVVGLPDETVVIVNGYVKINGLFLDEPYLLNPGAVYGNTFLPDCIEKTIPKGSFFVMGDNRLVSLDSRIIGFVKAEEFEGIIKAEQTYAPPSAYPPRAELPLELSWEEYLDLLNDRRVQTASQVLIPQPKLDQAAVRLADLVRENYPEYQDQLDLDEALRSVNYTYNVAHYYVALGQLDAASLLDQIFESEREKSFFHESAYEEIGHARAAISYGACEVPVTVVIISRKIMPEYDASEVDSWKRANLRSQELLASWESYRDKAGINEVILGRLLRNLNEASLIAKEIANKMVNGEWLTKQDYTNITRYNELMSEISKDAARL